MREKGGDDPVVTLSDDVVTLRPWSRDEAGFIVDACADPAVCRYNSVPIPYSVFGYWLATT